MGNYKDVTAWQKAMDLIDAVYDAVKSFPKSELFHLSQQMRSAATSIASNIAEGNGRDTTADYRRFVFQARGSAYELETHILIATRRRFITEGLSHDLLASTQEVCRLLNGLVKYLNRHT